MPGMIDNTKQFAGQMLAAINKPYVTYPAAAGAAGGLGYAAGNAMAMPSQDKQYNQAYAMIESMIPDASPEDIDYETQRVLYDHRGDMTPLMEGGNWREFAEKQQQMARSMPLDASGTEVGYM